MTEPIIIDHSYEPGAYGRCGYMKCGKRKAAHGEPPPLGTFDPKNVEGLAFTHTMEPVTVRPTVVLQRRGQPPLDLDWPPEWPLPLAGQVVRYDLGVEVVITAVTFDVDGRRLVLHSK